MNFGVTFFPDVGPKQKSGQQYYREVFDYIDLADRLGFDSAKIVEHYFMPYGGYSPDPLQFLAAVSQRSKRMRLITGAVLPAFNNPLQLAARIALLDCISEGRLEVGIARAFLPIEFDHFGVSMDDSRPLYEESIDILRRLLTEESVTHSGRFFKFENVSSFPQPVQSPHPPFYVTAFRTPDSFEYAAKHGYNIMITPFFLNIEELGDLTRRYREAWVEAGHKPGTEKVNINYRTYIAESGREAVERAEKYVRNYIDAMVIPLRAHRDRPSAQYPGYDKFVDQVENFPYEKIVKQAFIGSPEEIRDRIHAFEELCGGPIYPSIDFNYGNMPVEEATRNLTMFADEVMSKV
jgi:alkanesulfonate monooxygenase SsuD/methylene tetrahydromethanopterin reductase-like flavin-dependent oxidoreductase (luciferase family)